MVEQKRHRHRPEVVSGCDLHGVEPIGGKRFVDEVPLTIHNLLAGEALATVKGMMAFVAEDDQIVIGVVRTINVNVVLRKNPYASGATNRARIVCFDKHALVKVHLSFSVRWITGRKAYFSIPHDITNKRRQAMRTGRSTINNMAPLEAMIWKARSDGDSCRFSQVDFTPSIGSGSPSLWRRVSSISTLGGRLL